jgi:sulfonate transport system permease protein
MKTALAAFLLVALWAGVSASGALAPYVLPSPADVVRAIRVEMLSGILATAARCVIGYLAGAFIAYCAILAAHVTGTLRGADTQFSAARAVPGIAAMPLFLLWFGLGEFARGLVVVLTVLAFIAGPLAEAARKLPREWRIQRQRLGQSLAWEFFHVIAPGTLGPMIGSLRVGLAVALTTAVATDFMGSSAGIGQLIFVASVTFNVPAIFLLLLLTAILGLLLDRLLAMALRNVAHWVGETAKG